MREANHALIGSRRIEHRQRITEELNRVAGGVMDVSSKPRDVRSIESSRTVKVEAYRERCGRGAEGQAIATSEDASHFPTSDDLVHPTRNATAETLSATERQLVNEVRIDEVTNVEVRGSAADAEIGH